MKKSHGHSMTWLFFVLWFTYLFFYQGGFDNYNTRFNLSLSLAFRHSFQIDPYQDNTIDKAFGNGHYYSEKAPLVSFLALPVPLVASAFVSEEEILRNERLADRLLYLATIFTMGALTALAGVAFVSILQALQPSLGAGSASLRTFFLYTGTLIFPYATMLFGHQLAANFLVFSLYFFLKATQPQRPTRNFVLSWIMLGLAVSAEFPVAAPAFFCALGFLFFLSNAKLRKIFLLTAPAALLPLGLVLANNYFCFGSAFSFGYGKLNETPFATQMSKGLFGITRPDPIVALQLLFSAYRGIFVYSPYLLLAALGYRFCPKDSRMRLSICLVAGFISAVLVNSSYAYWQGGTGFGPRHLVPAIPLLGIGLAFLPERLLKIFSPVILLSVLIAFVATATTPLISEFDPQPLTHSYPGLVLNSAIALNPASFLTPSHELQYLWDHPGEKPLAAFNLGQLVGLKGWWSVLPVLLVWIAFLLGPAVISFRSLRQARARHFLL